jgi:hypothetical protein
VRGEESKVQNTEGKRRGEYRIQKGRGQKREESRRE